MYFDNASTSFPKPKSVIRGINDYLLHEQGNSQRTTTTKERDIVFETREKLARLFGTRFPSSIIFTSNATESLNTIIYGVLEKGDHVVTTATEHNSVIRPLMDLKDQGLITISWVECDRYGYINSNSIMNKVKENTKLVIINHGSNVTGSVQNIEEIGQRLKKYHKALFLIDASQTAGHLDIDNEVISADFIAFTGHKGLFGSTGIGGFYINPTIDIKPLKVGGTGVLSELLGQPQGLPLKYESGTLNLLGIHSLFHSIDYLNSVGIDKIGVDLEEKTEYIIRHLTEFKELEVYSKENKLGIVSFNITGIQPVRVSHFLEKELNLKSRSGLLCAPLIHEHIHKNPFGCVRISTSHVTKIEEIDSFINFISIIVDNLGKVRNIKSPEIFDAPSIYNI